VSPYWSTSLEGGVSEGKDSIGSSGLVASSRTMLVVCRLEKVVAVVVLSGKKSVACEVQHGSIMSIFKPAAAAARHRTFNGTA
jgi:hypothetical protein